MQQISNTRRLAGIFFACAILLALSSILSLLKTQLAQAESAQCFSRGKTYYSALDSCPAASSFTTYKSSGGTTLSAPQNDKCYLGTTFTDKQSFVEQDCPELIEKARGLPTYHENDCDEVNVNQENCGIIKYLVIFINLLSGLVGVVVVGSIIYGGIQYSASGGDPQKVSESKKRIYNSVFALVSFLFMYAFLQWIIPGGVF